MRALHVWTGQPEPLSHLAVYATARAAGVEFNVLARAARQRVARRALKLLHRRAGQEGDPQKQCGQYPEIRSPDESFAAAGGGAEPAMAEPREEQEADRDDGDLEPQCY